MTDKKREIYIVIVIMLLCVGIIFTSKSVFSGGFVEDKLNKNIEYYKGKVVTVSQNSLKDDPYVDNVEIGLQKCKVKVLEGPFEGEEHEINHNVSRAYNIIAKEGMNVVLAIYEENGQIEDINISNYQRSHIIGVLAILFIVITLIVGKFKGLKSLISLLFTGTSIVYLMLPMLFKGVSPILAAILVVALSTVVTLTLISGFNKKTMVSVIGTLSGVILSAIIAFLFGRYANLSGITMNDADSMFYLAEYSELRIQGLMFASIIIAALGAVMDVAVSLTSAIFELYEVNNKLSVKDLIKSGMNIGTDMIGTMCNTLILAFAGGSLNTLILLYSASMNKAQLFNLDILGTEIIQALSGSIGIILTVPITVFVASYICTKKEKC
ncbi:YibE/F family protein [Romboutsia ilealis]|uniref:YibE/F family protein n=1 Tax=Romboutsia faecis TaxID=2764597 RepID=A0ABR7JTP4_9FIRM|nr:YibE/F family protein [Romboutsia faecis]MBC5998282.1 YibE/F family protein [Romboutsia faecis]MRN25930.1 YibE/F family protein [Romboutsia ilealis]